MKKKILGLLGAGIIILGVTACGDADETKYAIIENTTSESDQLCTESAWKGVQQFAAENSANAGKYAAEGTERKDYANAIEEAVDEGAEVIVCVGDEMAVPVYEAQNDYRRVTFVLLNADPHKRYSEKANISENTIALHFDPVAESYLAGYMAVANGARDIGCMGGAENTESQMVSSGFIQGAEAAATDLGLTEGTVKIRYTFTGADKLSPAYMSTALTWYTDGCEVIFAPNNQVRTAVIQAAENAQRQVIGIGESSMTESDTMLTASYINYPGAVYQQLQNIKDKTFTGGQSLLCGAKENAVAIVIEGSKLEQAAAIQFDGICQKLANGQAKIDSDAKMPKTTLVTVEADGSSEADQAVGNDGSSETDQAVGTDESSQADQTAENGASSDADQTTDAE